MTERSARASADQDSTTGESADAPPDNGIQIRSLQTNDEFLACVDLQRDIWGWEQSEIVPATLLHVVEYVGGLAVGAFDAENTLLGFVFGITGVRDGELAHWSHMLGVRESTRDHGVGRMLKEHQRDVLRTIGVKRIYWSFDPLQSKNAYFNINRLRAAVESYVPDMYGTTRSPLHLGMATDRIVARLDAESELVEPAGLETERGVPVLTPYPRPNDAVLSTGDETPPIVLIEIPESIGEVLDTSAATAQSWRAAVRQHFQWALSKHYTVASVHRGNDGRTYYVAVR